MMLAKGTEQSQLAGPGPASDALSAKRGAPTVAEPKEDAEAPTPTEPLPWINGP